MSAPQSDSGAAAGPVLPKGSLWRTVKAVAWSFLGIRRNSAFQQDISQLNPFHIIIVGLAGGLLFVVGLMFFVNWVVTP